MLRTGTLNSTLRKKSDLEPEDKVLRLPLWPIGGIYHMCYELGGLRLPEAELADLNSCVAVTRAGPSCPKIFPKVLAA